MHLLSPPLPSDPWEAQRWEHSRLRRRLLTGSWKQDLAHRYALEMGKVRADAHGDPDTSSNVFAQICSSLACLYDVEPRVLHGDPVASEVMAGALAKAGWAAILQDVQRLAVGINEHLVHVRSTAEGVVLRPVPPDLVQATEDLDRPGRATSVREACLRLDPTTGRQEWTYSVARLVPGGLLESIQDAQGHDLSIRYGLPEGGVLHPGRTRLPYVVYHARVHGRLWSPFDGSELVEGTLKAGVLWTFFGHAVRTASWPQRYAFNVELPGASTDRDGDGVRINEVVADPATVLILQPGEGGGQPLIGQWAVGADPTSILDAVSTYERRLAVASGISASDIVRMSGDPRSGFALAVSSEGKRSAARKYEPAFRRGDQELLAVVAELLGLPTEGWDVEYRSLPPTHEETRSRREHVVELLREGMISRLDAYSEIHGVSRAEAQAALTAIANERIQT